MLVMRVSKLFFYAVLKEDFIEHIYVAPAPDEPSLYSQFSKIKIQTLHKHAIRYLFFIS